MRVVVLAMEKVVFESMAKEVILPGDEGEITVLDFHQPFLYRLENGSIRIDNKKRIPIRQGLAKMRGNELVILAEN